jgi:hypothetical protein
MIFQLNKPRFYSPSLSFFQVLTVNLVFVASLFILAFLAVGVYVFVSSPANPELSPEAARVVAESGPCSSEGTVGTVTYRNDESHTWWFNFTPTFPKSGCNPACVVDEQNNSSSVNWRCTGLVEPSLSQADAFALAREGDCAQQGIVSQPAIHNEETRSWWFEFTPTHAVSGCNPACVVDEVNRSSSINWRCLGLDEQQIQSQDEAFSVAQSGQCADVGVVSNTAIHNHDTQTWWFDLALFEPKDGCNPACVVNDLNRTSVVNWRCTGLIVP